MCDCVPVQTFDKVNAGMNYLQLGIGDVLDFIEAYRNGNQQELLSAVELLLMHLYQTDDTQDYDRFKERIKVHKIRMQAGG